MLAAEVKPGRVYLVWCSRKLRPVLIQGHNRSGWYGVFYPRGGAVRIKKASNVSEEYRQLPDSTVDFKSRAAGERED